MPSKYPSFVLVWALAACGTSSANAPPGGSTGIDSGHDGADTGTAIGPGDDSSTATDAGDASVPSDGSGGHDATTSTDAGGTDGGAVHADGGGGDGGIRDVGSCCSAQTTPGCNDANLEVCVCEKDQTCCTTAWGLQCALIVQQKYCQTGVRTCVCGTDVDAGQWDQPQCSTDWTSFCDSVATNKCGAVSGCF